MVHKCVWLLAGELLLCALRALVRGATHMWRSIRAILHQVRATRVSSRLSTALGTGEGGILVYHQIITKLHKVEHARTSVLKSMPRAFSAAVAMSSGSGPSRGAGDGVGAGGAETIKVRQEPLGGWPHARELMFVFCMHR